MKKSILILFVIALFLFSVPVIADEEKRIIAHVTSDEDVDELESQGCKIVHKLKDSTSFACTSQVASKVDSEREDVEEDQIFWILDLQADQQIRADQVWALGYNGSGVNVAVLDTGVDLTHPELISSIAGGKSFVAYTASFADDNGHGTHVSGIITSDGVVNANSKGATTGAGVWMAKVCSAAGSCFASDIAAAIEFVVLGQDGLANTGDEPAKIMSISLGGGGTDKANCDADFLASKVNWAVANGVTAVIAAGNTAGKVSSPGCASGAIAVGAVDNLDVRAGFSGSGNALDIMAPGVNILSTLPGGYGFASGTSMATPHVSAVVALLRQVSSALTDAQIKNALFSTAKDLGAIGWDTLYGWGRVDALAAVQSIIPDTTPPVISNIIANSTSTSATIIWTTNEPATSRVDYGLTAAYGSIVSNLNLVTFHSITLTGLSPSTLYHFKVTSADAANNSASSIDLTFTTSASPTLVSISVTPVNPSAVVGSTLQFTATGMYSDGTTADITNSVVWASSNAAVAAISATGLATALSAGTTTISATSGAIVGSTTLTVTAPPVDTPPTVTITNPSNGSTVSNRVTIQATASDNIGVTKVEFYIDNTLRFTDTTAPYSFRWDTRKVPNGLHTIKAVAYDTAGNSGSHQITVTVLNSRNSD